MNLFRLQIHPQHLASFKAVAPVLYLLTGGVIAAWAYFSVASPQRVGHYLTLHQVLETLSIAVSALVFAVGWKAHSLNPQRNVLILACGFLGVAILDFSHMLSFAGMPDYITPNSVAKGINFWLPARYLGGSDASGGGGAALARARRCSSTWPWQIFGAGAGTGRCRSHPRRCVLVSTVVPADL